MKALLLAAGRATRLGDLSLTAPKCLQRLGDEPLLDRLIQQLSAAGVEEFLVNTHHLAPMVQNHIQSRNDHSRFTVVYEPELLGTLGTLRANSGFFNRQPGWVLHADNYISGTLLGLREGFDLRPPECVGAMLTFSTDYPSACGVALTDEKGIVTAFFEKKPDPPSNEASAATFIFDDRVISRLDQIPKDKTDISHDLLPYLLNRIVTVPHCGKIVDIGTREGLVRARALAQTE